MAVHLLTKPSGPPTYPACCSPLHSVLIQACISFCTLELSVLLSNRGKCEHTCSEQMWTLTLHGYCTACISPPLQPFDEVLAMVVVVVTIVMESGCSVCDLRAGLQLLWTDIQLGAEANSATSQAPGMSGKANAIQCRIDLDPMKILALEGSVILHQLCASAARVCSEPTMAAGDGIWLMQAGASVRLPSVKVWLGRRGVNHNWSTYSRL